MYMCFCLCRNLGLALKGREGEIGVKFCVVLEKGEECWCGQRSVKLKRMF